jgi:hypothetical protein
MLSQEHIGQLIQMGILEIDPEDHQKTRLTPDAGKILIDYESTGGATDPLKTELTRAALTELALENTGMEMKHRYLDLE